MYEGST